ncbi:hypothetical protein [Lacisediminihabitans profunda]|uniref:Uncharacterized protein n=1 Tax=Lacisediminihabitans profunda TaxID=2594790 RepID=A0A5C8URD2_9MICO|nr:hypothetical protein [Lacisediminihabitans profunda]TXN31065.1 hypothetical protein FVP33_05580 [Lacisediminihabitans profunda]
MTPRRATRRDPLALSLTRIACLVLAAGSVVGMFLVAPGSATLARADASSAITVKWANDSSSASSFQPARDPASVHYAGFKNLAVKIEQTTGITNQALQVDISGFAATKQATDANGDTWSSAENFFQAMQCWGPDPLAADFNETCEWGGRYANNNGLNRSVYLDNIPRVAAKDIQASALNATDVPFRTSGGTSVTGRQVIQAGSSTVTYPLLDYFGPATTNEVQSVRINGDGTGVFNFEAQTSEEAPQLGCGTAEHLRCWLVLVPRGTVYGGHDNSCSDILDGSYNPFTYGRPNSIQAGSPVNPGCDYWSNRINIPLDFNATGSTCARGNTERRLVGSQLLVGAMASWQPQLCDDLKTTFSFATNPDSVARQQLLDQQAGLAFSSFPIVGSELDSQLGVTELANSKFSYAPITVTSADVAFFAEGTDGRVNDLHLSPRLLAKLLTQSYRFLVPSSASDDSSKKYLQLGTVNRTYAYLNQDPDFRALNPNWAQFSSNPAIVIPGPAGADAIRQVWKWIQADKEAAAWLAGAPDDWGMTINPYYLPKGDARAMVPTFTEAGALALDSNGASILNPVGLSNADSSPFALSKTTLDNFPKGDDSHVPLKLNIERYRFGTLQSAPYSDNFLSAARTVFRADPGAKTVWDPTAINAAGVAGDWVSGGAQVAGQRFMIAITDAPSARRYALSSAALRLDNSTTKFVAPTADSLSAALDSALTATSEPAVQQIDPAKVVDAGYPLTAVVYATVNLTGSDAAARTDFSRFIAQVTTKGQVPGTQLGELPPGYIPLTPALAGQAAAASAAVASFVTPTVPASADSSSNGYAQDSFTAAGSGASAASGGLASGSQRPGIGASSSPAPTASNGRTPTATNVSPIAQMALSGSLATGLSGALFAPLLFRGRRLR